MNSTYTRAAQLERLESEAGPWDIVVIGGGATGVGVAVDAASRGYRVALLERHDFGKGTSSRSTKLIHGGLRYLRQGRFRLVREALVERGLLRQNAPHLVRLLPTVVPVYSWIESLYFGFGLKTYERLSGRWSFGHSRRLTYEETIAAIPTIEHERLYGGVSYLDGAFDDTRLLVNLVLTAMEHGAVCANYAQVREFVKESGRITGVVVEDVESGNSLRVPARVVVNATGPFTDEILALDEPNSLPVIAPSQGIHLVLDRAFLPCESALIVPKTRDGRVIFAIPWHNHTVIGTTDTPRRDVLVEPKPLPGEIDYLIETISPYLANKPERSDIRSIFAGIRPLVRSGHVDRTSALGRDHEIRVADSGLISVLGGKWTTYRRMAEDCVNRSIHVGALSPKPCLTRSIRIHGHPGNAGPVRFSEYGSDAPALEQLMTETPGATEQLSARLPYLAGHAIFAVRHEMGRTVEDVLARRLRALFLDVEAALEAAPRVATIVARELRRDMRWQADQLDQFYAVAQTFRYSNC